VVACHLLLAESADEEERKLTQPASDDVQEVERRVVGPVQVLEHDDRPRLAAPQDGEKRLENTIPIAFIESRPERPGGPRSDVRQGGERPSGHDAVAGSPERLVPCSLTAEGVDESRLADACLARDEKQAPVPLSGAQVLGHPVEQGLAFQETH